jgi:hypothetical protein
MATAPADDKPVYLWVRGFPEGGPEEPAARVFGLLRVGWSEGLGVELIPSRFEGMSKSDFALQVKGFHARPLALTEAGTHLVLPRHGGPVPVRVAVCDAWPPRPADEFAFGPIVRVYPEGRPVMDVRTGLVSAPPHIPDVLRTFTLAALPRATR